MADDNFKKGPLAKSKYANYLESLTPEQIAKRYFAKANGKKFIDELGDEKVAEINGTPRYKYAMYFSGSDASYFNGLFVHYLEECLPAGIKLNTRAYVEDIEKFIGELSLEDRLDLRTDLTQVHNYVVDFAMEMLKICGKGLKYICKNSKDLSI